MIDVIRFCDKEGMGIFNSRFFDYDYVWHCSDYPHLGELIRETNHQVRVPQVSWCYKHRSMYKTGFLKQLFTQDQLVELVSECEANRLDVRYGRVRPDTPTYEDEHQVIVPITSIYRMKHGVGDISGLLKHVGPCWDTAARP